MSCFKDHVYPFTAIVGQERMKKALVLNAINPKIGGVLIRGEKGTAKSTVVRALADLLPEIEVVEGCRYGCDPRDEAKLCVECKERTSRGEELASSRRKMRVVNLPINATQDRVAGTIDIEHAIKKGEKRFEPGILAEANRGILYVDEVNLLGDHIVDILLDSAAMGVNVVEREGVSYSHPAHFILVGTMNPEEGEIRPQLLDRFALCVDVEGIRAIEDRVAIIQRRLAYEADPHEFCHRWDGEQAALAEKIVASEKALPGVAMPEDVLRMIARISVDLGVDGHRADIVMMKAAATIAAFRGRGAVTADDVRESAELVYPHRMRKKPFEEAAGSEKISEAIDRSAQPEDAPAEGESRDSPPPGDGDSGQDRQFSIGGPAALPPIAPKKDRMPRSVAGRRVDSPASTTAGAYVRSEPFRDGDTDVAFDATFRAAAPYQARRDRDAAGIAIEKSDLRRKVRQRKVGSTILFVVDASGSMGARQRMESAKGAVMSLLVDAYQHRDRVGLIAFRGEGAEVLLPPTSSVELAKKGLESMPTGGKTPLARGLSKAVEVLRSEVRTNPESKPVLVLVTDGKANVPLNGGDPVQEALGIAGEICGEGLPMMVVDTESDFINLGLARSIAEAAGAQYCKLDEVSAEGIAGIVRDSGVLG